MLLLVLAFNVMVVCATIFAAAAAAAITGIIVVPPPPPPIPSMELLALFQSAGVAQLALEAVNTVWATRLPALHTYPLCAERYRQSVKYRMIPTYSPGPPFLLTGGGASIGCT